MGLRFGGSAVREDPREHVAVVGAVFRVSTAPDRIKERRNTAYSVCIASGGEWVKGERDEACVKPDAAKKP